MDVHDDESLRHPEFGELPARRVLDCVFALTPDGRISHYHVAQVTVERTANGVHYVLTDAPAPPEHSRCRIIPPLVTEFPKPGGR